MRCGSCLVKVGISSAILGVMTAILTSWFQAKRYEKIRDGDTFQFLNIFFMGISADFLMFHFVSRFTPFCKPTKIGSKDMKKTQLPKEQQDLHLVNFHEISRCSSPCFHHEFSLVIRGPFFQVLLWWSSTSPLWRWAQMGPSEMSPAWGWRAETFFGWFLNVFKPLNLMEIEPSSAS